MLHTVKLKGRRIANIDSPHSDLAGHTLTRYSQGTDQMKVVFDRAMWKGYKDYSVIFWRSDDPTAPRKEYALSFENPVVPIPGSMTTEPGIVNFAIKALDPETGKRLMAADENGFFEVLESGAIDGSYGNEDQLTRLEDALEKVEKIGDAEQRAEDALRRAEDAVRRAESIADLDYTVLKNKPKIEDVTLDGNRQIQDFGVTQASAEDIYLMF